MKKESSVYIRPNLYFYSSFEEAFSEESEAMRAFSSTEKEEWEFDDLCKVQHNFVVAEPGCGKTRLLKEIVDNSIQGKQEAILIECKKILESNVEEAIHKIANQENTIKTEQFKLENVRSQVVCLDALDEIKLDAFSRTVEKIREFLVHYDKVTVVISCRRQFFQKFKYLFTGLTFGYTTISHFELRQVISFLEENQISKADVNKIIELLSVPERELVIQTPRYLELVVDYVKEKGIVYVAKLTRTELFEYFIYKKLKLEDERLTQQKGDMIKRVLEKLALIMEIYQTNMLTKDELMTFFDNLQSDLKLTMLQQIPIEVLFDKTLLKDNIDSVEFENTEFQEYLAAKEITRLSKNSHLIYDLFVDSELRQIYPSWFSTLKFLIDLDISYLKTILDFVQKGEGKIQDEEYHRLLATVHVESLDIEIRKQIFFQVFSYFQTVLHWMAYDVARGLSYYFTEPQYDFLRQYITDAEKLEVMENRRFVRLGNVAQIVGFLFERNIFSTQQIQHLKRKLIQWVNDTNKNGVLQRHALTALRGLKDKSVIKEVKAAFSSDDELIRDAFLVLCQEVDPNGSDSIHYFIEGTKKRSLYARHGLWVVNERSTIKDLLKAFVDDSTFLVMFVDQESIFKDRDKQILQNIDNAWDSDICAILESIVLKSLISSDANWYRAKESKFIRKIACLIQVKKQKFFLDLVTKLIKSKRFKRNLFTHIDFISHLLKKSQVQEFISLMSQIEDGKKDAAWIIRFIKNSERKDSEAIYREGKQHLFNEFKEIERELEKQRKEFENKNDTEQSQDNSVYGQFVAKLEPVQGSYDPGVFRFYLNNKEEIEAFIKPVEKERLTTLLRNIVLNGFDPIKQDFKLEEKSGGSFSFTTDYRNQFFLDAILTVRELGLDIAQYRQQIINYIPFAFDAEVELIFDLIKELQAEELRDVLEIYKEKSSDIRRFQPINFIRTCERYMLKEAVPVLRVFVDETKFQKYQRMNALKTLEAINPDASYLKIVFKNYISKKSELKEIAEEANRLLIQNHQDQSAISWRMTELKKRAFPHEKMSSNQVRYGRDELLDREFAEPIMMIKDPKYQKHFLSLLGKSFSLLKKDKYFDYVQYLWGITTAYFDNLKEEKSYEPLKNLESFVQQHSPVENINWFGYKLKELNRSYLSFIGKPTNVNDCIKKYNSLKSSQYLEIATPYDLLKKVKKIIESDLRRWVASGAYSFIVGTKVRQAKQQQYENLIQKTVKPQIQYLLLKNGLHDSEVIREPQLDDGKKVDFLIYYGFIGPILIEVKLSTSSDLSGSPSTLKTQKSYKRVVQYMDGFNAYYGIFLVFDNKKRSEKTHKWQTHFAKITDAYQQIKNVEVIGIECA